MGYKVERAEGMADAIRRIVVEQVSNAIDQLEGRGEQDRDDAVHDARKSLKKARSALRLARHDIGDEARAEENAALRDAGRRLSGARDAQVLLETLEKVAADDRLPAPREGVAALRSALEERRAEVVAEVHDDEGAAADVVRELEGVRGRAPEWPLDEQGFRCVERGLRRILDKGRDARDAALAHDADDEAWHEWRKRVKDLWYSLRVLEPVAPRMLGGMVAEADELSDVLGDHNDLAVLVGAIDEHADVLEPAHAEQLTAAVRRRADELRLRSVPLGMRLYAESPKAFARRLDVYWQARAAQAEADATWLAPELAARIREVLAEKETADDAKRKRALSAELRSLGFRVSDYEDDVGSRRGGFAAADFDALVERGRIRIAAPPASRPPNGKRRSGKDGKTSGKAGKGSSRDDGEGDGGLGLPSPADVTKAAVGLASEAARRASRTLGP